MLIHLEKDSKSKQTPEKIERKKELSRCKHQWQSKGKELELAITLHITSFNKVKLDVLI